MKNNVILFFTSFTFCLLSCNDHSLDSVKNDQALQQEKSVQQEALRLEIAKAKTMDIDLDANISTQEMESQLFGKFFDERAEFFVIEEPHKTILSAKVKKMTLFFLDGKLSKLKYLLDANISNELLNNYGRCKITGLDPDDRYHMTHDDVILKENNKYSLSDKLKNYQIQWDLEDKSLVMRVRTVENNKLYEYEEKVKNYEKNFKSLEYNKISL